ncbi:nuclease-related domain-containing protein [Pseudalkalibacillus sp. SCS-8]|uniref:nuclease-related domain-containing protein n=1 Tax=Pseudalkalibacillus nanhaiensis TaxID=3115291 RepID=UPI0032D9D853
MELMKPLTALQLMVMLNRSPAKDPQHAKHPLIKTRLKKLITGYKGEVSVEYQLRYLPSDQFVILHDVRIPIGDKYFQIDFLVLSRYFYTIIEVKNIFGELYFDPVFNQLIRKNQDGSKSGILDPTIQVETQKKQLEKWLNKNKLPIAPIKYLITISNPKTILSTSINNHHISNWIIHKHSLPENFEQFTANYPNAILTHNEIKKVTRKLRKQNEPLLSDVLQMYNFKPSDILTGVSCPNCYLVPIPRQKNRTRWICPVCKTESLSAYLSAIADYGLLFNQSFTNRQIRAFLGVDSRTTMYKLLQRMNVSLNGRTYTLPLKEIYHHANKDFPDVL